MANKPDPTGYDAKRAAAGDRSRAQSEKGRDIGPLPAVADPARRERCRRSLLDFCRTYFPRRFKLAFAGCHLTAISELESVTTDGGYLAVAMPRGSGKTAIAECAVLKAVLYGAQRFVVLAQATQPLAAKSLKKIKRELETNPLLLADFPEVCYPIARLERSTRRAQMQTLDGDPTMIEWTAEGVTLPTVAGSAASGSILTVAGVESASRGLSAPGPNGEVIRPGLIVVDDAQTRESARSPIQTDYREAIVTDDMAGMVGPGETLALVVLCTVIYPNDLSDRFLSPDKHPEFRRVRTKMIEAFPERMDLWEEYWELRREGLKAGVGPGEANEFYAAHRAAMDAGARVSWPDRKGKGDLSGLQAAMNLFFKNPRGFKAECQNDPDPPGGVSTAKELDPAQVAARLSGLARFEVPREATTLTAMIDTGGGKGRGLWYAVVAWDERFGGAVLDYGTWPRQARTFFAADDMRPGLAESYPKLAESERVYAGMEALTNEIAGREYRREGVGEHLRLNRLVIDAGWGPQAATIHKFCRQSAHAGIIYPSKGMGRTQTARGVGSWKPRPGEKSGHHWRITMSETGRGRMVQFDPDIWKSFLFERLTTPMGGAGCLVLFSAEAGQPGRKADHEMIGHHCAAESADPKELHGNVFDKWAVKPHRPDNHLFDVLVGCAVAASVQGVTWSAGGAAEAKRVKKKVDIEQLYAAQNQGDRP